MERGTGELGQQYNKKREDLFFWPYIYYITPRNRVHMQKLVVSQLEKK
jgi:hypothetical protein